MSLENGILGYLSIKPLSGYDIKKLFNMTAAYFWPADQAQIYRSLKKLVDDGLVELSEYSKGETVNKKVYAITDKGREALRDWIIDSNQSDFIVRSPYLMKMFFSGALTWEEQLGFIDAQIKLNNALIQKLKSNFNENNQSFAQTVELSKDDAQFESAVWSYRWGILRSEAYVKLLEDIKAEILGKKNNIQKSSNSLN